MQRVITTRLRRAGVASVAVAAALSVAFSASASAAKSASKVASAASACGSVPKVSYHDESGLIAKLGAPYTTEFNGYSTPIYKSDYANFKPKGKPPYTVGLAVSEADTPTQAVLNPAIKSAMEQIPGVKKVIELTVGPTALTTQIQQVHELIQEKVSFIVVQPLVSQSFVSLAKAAEAAHIPFISIYNATPSPASINIAPNSVNDGLTSGAELAKAIGGKGLVVGVQGIPGVGVNTEQMEGWKTAFAQCPGITFDNSVIGEFQPSVAKSAMLSYLSSHPQTIAGVVETANMTIGIIQAFQQAGRPVPKIVDIGPSVGEFVYFKSNPGELISAASIPPNGVINAVKYTIEKLIKGQGPKISEISELSPTFDVKDLSQYIPSGASESDESQPNITWFSGTYLSKLFS